ncbi:uncharacterized protein LOC120330031 [Styela clava]
MISRLAVLTYLGVLAVSKATSNKECTLPVFEKIDVSKVPGIWYQVLNSKDPVEQQVPCYVTKDMKRISNDGEYLSGEIVLAVENGKVFSDPIPGHAWFYGDTSITMSDEKYEHYFINEAKSHGANEEALKEVHEFYALPMSEVTDYENYILHMQCSSAGDKYVWASMRHNHPTPVDILRIHNKLADIGGGWSQVKLYFGGCTNFEKIY